MVTIAHAPLHRTTRRRDHRRPAGTRVVVVRGARRLAVGVATVLVVLLAWGLASTSSLGPAEQRNHQVPVQLPSPRPAGW